MLPRMSNVKLTRLFTVTLRMRAPTVNSNSPPKAPPLPPLCRIMPSAPHPLLLCRHIRRLLTRAGKVLRRFRWAKGTPKGNMKLFHARMKGNTCTICEIGLFTEEEDVEEIGVLAISCM